MRTARENYEPSSREHDELCTRIFYAVRGRTQTPAEVIGMNIELVRQRMPELAGFAFHRAQQTIENLERQLEAEVRKRPADVPTDGLWWLRGVTRE